MGQNTSTDLRPAGNVVPFKFLTSWFLQLRCCCFSSSSPPPPPPPPAELLTMTCVIDFSLDLMTFYLSDITVTVDPALIIKCLSDSNIGQFKQTAPESGSDNEHIKRTLRSGNNNELTLHTSSLLNRNSCDMFTCL